MSIPASISTSKLRKNFTARAFIDVYIDPHREVEVIGFDNFTVVVKPLSRSAEEEA